MPMELLQRLCCARLPLNIEDQADIRKCELLRTAHLIEADLPPILDWHGASAYSGHATVMRVTRKGHAVLEMRTGIATCAPQAEPAPRMPTQPTSGLLPYHWTPQA